MAEDAIDHDKGQVFSWVWFGFIATALYFVAVAFILWSAGPESLVQIKFGMELNEFADAIAGIFAPLAFLWLFVATMVQSQELALQRTELQLTRREFVQNREVAKEQAAEARNQAEFIGTQTELFVRAEADKHLNALLISLKELLRNGFSSQIKLSAPDGVEYGLARGPGVGDLSHLGGLVASVHICAQDIKISLEAQPEWKAHHDRSPFVAFRSLVGEIKAVLPGTSPAQRAVLNGADFGKFLADTDYLFSIFFDELDPERLISRPSQ